MKNKRFEIFNKNVNDKNYSLKLILPVIGTVDEYNEFSDDHYRGFQILLDTSLIYAHDEGYYHVAVCIFGFGVSFSKNQYY